MDAGESTEIGEGWTSSYTDPMAAAPAELQAIWPSFPSV